MPQKDQSLSNTVGLLTSRNGLFSIGIEFSCMVLPAGVIFGVVRRIIGCSGRKLAPPT